MKVKKLIPKGRIICCNGIFEPKIPLKFSRKKFVYLKYPNKATLQTIPKTRIDFLLKVLFSPILLSSLLLLKVVPIR